MTLSRRSTIKAIGVVGAGSALTGTALAVNEHEDDERDPADAPAEDEEVGALRVGHFSPDAPNVDVYVDDEQVLSDVGYDDLSPYLEIAPGTYTVTITAAGEEESVYEETVSLDAEYYTAAAIGELEGEIDPAADDPDADAVDEPGVGDDAADDVDPDPGPPDDEPAADDETNCGDPAPEDGDAPDETPSEDDVTEETDDDVADPDEPTPEEPAEPDTGTFELLLLVDAGPEDVQADTSQIRVVHASPDAPAVDVLDAETASPVFEGVDFGEPSGYVPVDPGPRTLDIAPADGEMDPDDATADAPADGETDPDDAAADAPDDEPADDVQEDDPADDETPGVDPVASVDVDLEAETAYTAFAIGYLEEDDVSVEADDAPVDDGADDEETAEEAIDEPEAEDDEHDEYGPEDDDYDDYDDDEDVTDEVDPEDEVDEPDVDDPEDEVDEPDVDDEPDGRPFTVRLAVDGMTDETPEEPAPEADEPTDEPGEDPTDDAAAADD